MKPSRAIPVATAAALSAVAASFAPAATLYWDTNGAVAGAATSGTANGAWLGNFWSTASDGTATPGAYASGSDVHFSADTDTTRAAVTLSTADVTAGSITFEEGSTTVSGTKNLTVGFDGITVASGASAVISTGLNLNTGGTTYVTLSAASNKSATLTLAANGTTSYASPLVIRGTKLGQGTGNGYTNVLFSKPTMVGSGPVASPTVGVMSHVFGDTTPTGFGSGIVTYDSAIGARLLNGNEYLTNVVTAGNNVMINGAANSSGTVTLNSLQFTGSNPSISGSGTISTNTADVFVAAGTNASMAQTLGSGIVSAMVNGQLTVGGVSAATSGLNKFGSGTFTSLGTIDGGVNVNEGTVIAGGGTQHKIKFVTINNGTFKLGASNLTTTTAAVTIGGSTNPGTFELAAGVMDQVASVAFGAAGGTLKMTLGNTGGARLSAGDVNLNGGTVVFTDTPDGSVGKYTLLKSAAANALAGSIGGTAPAAYRLVTVGGSGGELDLIHRPTIGTITATPADSTIITGGSTAISGTVGNVAPINSDSLNFGISGSPEVTNSVTGTAVAQANGGFDGLAYAPTDLGLQTTTLTVTDPNATNSGQTATASVNVLGHSQAAFTSVAGATAHADGDTLTLDFGDVGQGSDRSATFNLTNVIAAAWQAGLDLDSITPANVNSNHFTLGGADGFANLPFGDSWGYLLSLDTSTLGSYASSYTFNVSDQDLPGATSRTLTLNVLGNVVAAPEPGSLGILALAGAALMTRRRQK